MRRIAHGCGGWAAILSVLAIAAAAGAAEFDPADPASWLIPNADLYSVAARGDRAWAVGYWGTVLRSEDGGRSWTAAPTPTVEALYAVSFADDFNGWAVGANAALLRTSDGGLTWESLHVSSIDEFGDEQPLESSLFDVAAVSAHEAWVVGDFGVILHTRDGSDWERVVIPEELFGDDNVPDRIFNAVDFTDRTHGWIAGEFGTFLRTTDGGETWVGERTLSGAVEDVYLMDIAAEADGSAVAVGIGGVVLTTVDGGATWTTAPVSTTAGLFGVARRDSQAILLGDRGVLFRSGDGGRDWSLPTRPRLFNWLRGAAFGADGLAYVVGENGVILRSQDAGGAWERSVGEEPAPLEGISVPDPSRSTDPGREDLGRGEPGGVP